MTRVSGSRPLPDEDVLMPEGGQPVPLVVIGASAGGVEALRRLVGRLSGELPAAVLVVLHLSPTTHSVLPDILARAGTIRVVPACDGELVRPATVFVAVPDRHLRVIDGRISLSADAKENGHRPAIDPVLRSAALASGHRTLGMLLSGMLDDGVLGLAAIKSVGGVTAVQDPGQASYPSMPTSAIDAGVVDEVLELDDLAKLTDAWAASVTPTVAVPSGASVAGEPSGEALDPTRPDQPLGEVSALTCPSCGGALWESHVGEMLRFECRTGHAFSAQSLLDLQTEALDGAMWAAYRALLEKQDLSRRMARRFADDESLSVRYRRVADRAAGQAKVLRQALVSDAVDDDPTDNDGC